MGYNDARSQIIGRPQPLSPTWAGLSRALGASENEGSSVLSAREAGIRQAGWAVAIAPIDARANQILQMGDGVLFGIKGALGAGNDSTSLKGEVTCKSAVGQTVGDGLKAIGVLGDFRYRIDRQPMEDGGIRGIHWSEGVEGKATHCMTPAQWQD